jgi:Spy/CpxP family protein refolding chaperone
MNAIVLERKFSLAGYSMPLCYGAPFCLRDVPSRLQSKASAIRLASFALTRTLLLAAFAALGLFHLASFALAQDAPPQQPYAGLEQRAIKALSDDEIAELRAGRGMGLALAAELNGYPGPSHVLEHAEALELTLAQRQHTQAVFHAMKVEAVKLGERLIEQERALDRLFATKATTAPELDAATAAIATTQGALRAAHLRAHLAMLQVLTPEQVKRYGQLRGYGDGDAGQEHGHKPH